MQMVFVKQNAVSRDPQPSARNTLPSSASLRKASASRAFRISVVCRDFQRIHSSHYPQLRRRAMPVTLTDQKEHSDHGTREKHG